MNATERRQAILDALVFRREDTVENLAHEFDVSERTIQRDVAELSLSYPIESVAGRYGGGIKMATWYHPYRRTLAPEQSDAIRKAAQFLEGKEQQALLSVLAQFSALE
ncbi:MAG: HTH domain-containing protein [Clostridium sp.]|nr:HTH domain-containing protein [Clostridium sp.]